MPRPDPPASAGPNGIVQDMYLVGQNAALALPASLVALAVTLWQVVVTNDYRRRRLIETGL